MELEVHLPLELVQAPCTGGTDKVKYVDGEQSAVGKTLG